MCFGTAFQEHKNCYLEHVLSSKVTIAWQLRHKLNVNTIPLVSKYWCGQVSHSTKTFTKSCNCYCLFHGFCDKNRVNKNLPCQNFRKLNKVSLPSSQCGPRGTLHTTSSASWCTFTLQSTPIIATLYYWLMNVALIHVYEARLV